jgi:hypothetical protein
MFFATPLSLYSTTSNPLQPRGKLVIRIVCQTLAWHLITKEECILVRSPTRQALATSSSPLLA